jgi:hypothetical protein
MRVRRLVGRTGALAGGLAVALLAGAQAAGVEDWRADDEVGETAGGGAGPGRSVAIGLPATSAVLEAPGRLEPWIDRRMPGRLRARLQAAFPVAVDRLARHPRCRALFERLGRDALATLAGGLYYPVSVAQERDLCPGKAALTNVGGRQVRICPEFGRLAPREAAMILIHEALHLAGLGERPLDPRAPSSTEINDRVRGLCDL